MKFIKVLFLGLICMTFNMDEVEAQLFEQYSSVNRVKYTHNKATAGLAGEMELDLLYRTQWQGIEGNPRQFFASITSPLYILNGGVGLHFSTDAIGARNITSGGISYNYVLNSDVGLFSFGAGIGFRSARLDQNILTTPDGNIVGGRVNVDDPIISRGNASSSFTNMSFGLYYANGPFEAGIGYTKDNSSDFDFELGQSTGVMSFYAEYATDIQPDLALTPYAFVKSNSGNLTQYELGASVLYLDRFRGGLAVRGLTENSLDALVVNIGFGISPKLSFDYYYDAGLSSLAQQAEGSHEILLKYRFGQNIITTKPVKTIYNPRY